MQENALSPLYNNDITAEYLRDQSRPHFSDEALATFSPEALARVKENEAFKQAHPPLAFSGWQRNAARPAMAVSS